MRAAIAVCMVWVMTLGAASLQAQGLTTLARVEAGPSGLKDGWFGTTTLSLHLSQGVPYRVFTLDGPPRLVVDFREVDWTGVAPEDLLPEPGDVLAVRFGTFQPGWSRLVMDLSGPMLPDRIEMPVDTSSGAAVLSIRLSETDEAAFAAQSGPPDTPGWARALVAAPTQRAAPDNRFVVAIDPGHGGIDPGATADGVEEKNLMLTVAQALREQLLRAGVEVFLTRETDVFVALEQRVALAHQAQADLFISFHADSLSQGRAEGAAVYVLSSEASDAASAHLAARHNRADIIAGADLTGADDQIAGILLDLARQETGPRSDILAATLVQAMTEAGGPMHKRPLRRAGFSVLKSADIPSVLIELGFISSTRDLANLRDPVWRAGMVEAIARGILQWRDADATLKPLIRQ